MLTDLCRLQLSSMNGDKIIGVLAPNRKMHVVHPLLHLGQAEVVLLNIQQELRKIEELRDKLTHI